MNKRKIPANHFKKVKKQFPSSSIESVRSDQRNFLLPLNGGAVAFIEFKGVRCIRPQPSLDALDCYLTARGRKQSLVEG